ncbi:hypothetical protein AMTR_s00038p00122550 [Amborella trichopoda]|uniref:Uncharacterized protein n=1 Tax=Amborella trichopoda TaxID=13333 RepID=U5CZM3_AMBTC|nr:hypothetical protein AMTR_s00038p00122550 [Amborella trichopoda]
MPVPTVIAYLEKMTGDEKASPNHHCLSRKVPAWVVKNFSEWELAVNCGHLTVKVPSQNATLEHLYWVLLFAACLGNPIVVTKSSSEDDDLSPRSRKAAEMVSAMKTITVSIVVVEEAIGINDLNWNLAPKRKRVKT